MEARFEGRPVGIDVSKWQESIDWGVVWEHVDFAFIRCAYGVWEDDWFERNWSRSSWSAYRKPRGVYQYFLPHLCPIRQADLAWGMVRQLTEQGIPREQLPFVIDVEEKRGEPKSAVLRRVLAWCERMEHISGTVPMIYTGVYFWDGITTADMSRYPLWVARYTSAEDPGTPKSWQSAGWSVWQYSCEGEVPGIETKVDLNTCDSVPIPALSAMGAWRKAVDMGRKVMSAIMG